MRSTRARFSSSAAFDLVTTIETDAPDGSTIAQLACAAERVSVAWSANDPGRVAEALQQRRETPRPHEPHPRARVPVIAAPGHDRRVPLGPQRPLREIPPERRFDLRARHPQQGARVGPQDGARVGHEHQLVEVERFALLGDERGERQAPVVELAAVDGDERAVDELPRLARAGDELAVGLGLPSHFVGDAGAGRADLVVEALGLVAAPVLADDEAEPGGRHRRQDAEGDDQARSELHGVLLARDASPKSIPPDGVAPRVTSAT